MATIAISMEVPQKPKNITILYAKRTLSSAVMTFVHPYLFLHCAQWLGSGTSLDVNQHLDKANLVYMHRRIRLHSKEIEIKIFAENDELKVTMLNKVTQTQKNKTAQIFSPVQILNFSFCICVCVTVGHNIKRGQRRKRERMA